MAKAEGIQLDGMLGQLPLYQDFAVDVDPQAVGRDLKMSLETH